MNIQTPDIGVEKAVVSDILVKVGDVIAENDSIVALESDKAAVEVPSPSAGTVSAILVQIGDEVREGVALIAIDSTEQPDQSPSTIERQNDNALSDNTAAIPSNADLSNTAAISSGGEIADVTVPDIGVEKAMVSDILVKVGDVIAENDSIVALESDKAAVEVPSPLAGTVTEIGIHVGDVVKEGVLLLKVKTSAANQSVAQPSKTSVTATPTTSAESIVHSVAKSQPISSVTKSTDKLTAEQQAANAKVYAGPAVRQLARELGVILSEVAATGRNGRIVKDDVFAYVKQRLSQPQSITGGNVVSGLPPLPDFSAFGGGTLQTMSRLQQVSVPQLSLNNYIPQVTQFDLADITELEAWRGQLKDGFKQKGIHLTILAFIAKAVAYLLKEEPYFAAHLADDQKSVFLRNEIHMGIAVATDEGLTVPVLRNPDQKSIQQIAQELGELSRKARDKKLTPKDLQGANFTITSLGSIGGTAFTPLVNWPQVAILGLSPARMQPLWNGERFEPRLMLPLSLSYDHRVINGADAARFTHKLTELLKDIRNILL